MVQWCQRHLVPYAPEFEFHHQDVRNPGLNPNGAALVLPFPVADATVTLFVAWSVFTHVNEAAAAFYLGELGRVLHPAGLGITTWFLFDKPDFPMMQEFQNALFINDTDPTNAVIFDKTWLRATAHRAGLTLSRIHPPGVRDFSGGSRSERPWRTRHRPCSRPTWPSAACNAHPSCPPKHLV